MTVSPATAATGAINIRYGELPNYGTDNASTSYVITRESDLQAATAAIFKDLKGTDLKPGFYPSGIDFEAYIFMYNGERYAAFHSAEPKLPFGGPTVVAVEKAGIHCTGCLLRQEYGAVERLLGVAASEVNAKICAATGAAHVILNETDNGQQFQAARGAIKITQIKGSPSFAPIEERAIIVPIYPHKYSTNNMPNYDLLKGDIPGPELVALQARLDDKTLPPLKLGDVWDSPAIPGRPRAIFAVTFGEGINASHIEQAAKNSMTRIAALGLKHGDFALMHGGLQNFEPIVPAALSAESMAKGMFAAGVDRSVTGSVIVFDRDGDEAFRAFSEPFNQTVASASAEIAHPGRNQVGSPQPSPSLGGTTHG